MFSITMKLRFAFIVFATCFVCGTMGRTFSLDTIQQGRNFDMITATSLMPVTPPCFECTTQTAQPPNKICSDRVVTFKYACTDDPCHTTNPCLTPKPGCRKNKPKKKPCCIKNIKEAYRKRKLKTSKKNKKSKIMKKYGFI